MRSIELSIGKNYVTNWGLWEAIREIIQNGQDSEKEGNLLSIRYDSLKQILTITNEGAELDIQSLVLGNSIKSSPEAIGKYGEGYKLALVVLLRLGKDITITSDDEIWKPSFKESETFSTEVLTIEINSNEKTNKVEFKINNISNEEYQFLCIRSLRLLKETKPRKKLKEIECDYGKIILNDDLKGNFYVEGLFVQNDENFKYSYNFNVNEVDLDRDRKAINYYDLCALTTKSLLTQTENFEIVETSIEYKTHDSSDIKYFYNKASEDFKQGYALNYVTKHKKEKDTFFGTEKEVEIFKALEDSDDAVIVDEITASWLNDGLGNSERYYDIKAKAHEKQSEDLAMKLYEQSVLYELNNWLIKNCEQLTNDAVKDLLYILDGVHVSNIDNIRKDIRKQVRNACGIDED